MDNLLLVIGSIIFSLSALILIYFVLKKTINKMYFLGALYIELVVVFCLFTRNPGCFGLVVIPYMIPLIRKFIVIIKSSR